jgi:transcriptional regulator with XRE-family HTH domain
MSDLVDLGSAVRDRRTECQLSMREAATLAGISPTAWSDLEAGKHPPSLKTQRGVAKALDWNRAWAQMVTDGEDPPAVISPATLEGTLTRIVTMLEELTRRVADQHADLKKLLPPTRPRRRANP